jgi:hypothetical protein
MNSRNIYSGTHMPKESRQIRSPKSLLRPSSVKIPENSLARKLDDRLHNHPSSEKLTDNEHRVKNSHSFLKQTNHQCFQDTPRSGTHFRSISSMNFFNSFKDGFGLKSLTEREISALRDPNIESYSDSGFILRLDMDQPLQSFRNFHEDELNIPNGFSSSREIKFIDRLGESGDNSQNFAKFQKSQNTNATANFINSQNFQTDDLVNKSESFCYKTNQDFTSPSILKRNDDSSPNDRVTPKSNSKSNLILTDLPKSKDLQDLQEIVHELVSSSINPLFQNPLLNTGHIQVDRSVNTMSQNKSDVFKSQFKNNSALQKDALQTFFDKIQGVHSRIINLESRYEKSSVAFRSRLDSRERASSIVSRYAKAGSFKQIEEADDCKNQNQIELKRKTLSSSRIFRSKASLKHQESKETENSLKVSTNMNFEKSSESVTYNNRYQMSEMKIEAFKVTEQTNDQSKLLGSAKSHLKFTKVPFPKSFSIEKNVQIDEKNEKESVDLINKGILLKRYEPVDFKGLVSPKTNINLKSQFSNKDYKLEDTSKVNIQNFRTEPRYHDNSTLVDIPKKTNSFRQKVYSELEDKNTGLNVSPHLESANFDPEKIITIEPVAKNEVGIGETQPEIKNSDRNQSNHKALNLKIELSSSVRSFGVHKTMPESPDSKTKDYSEAKSFINSKNQRVMFSGKQISTKDSLSRKSPFSMFLNSSNESLKVNTYTRFNSEKQRLQNFQKFLDQIKINYHEKLEKATRFKNNILKPSQKTHPFNKDLFQNLENTYRDFKAEVQAQNILLNKNLKIFEEQVIIVEKVQEIFSKLNGSLDQAEITQNLNCLNEHFFNLEKLQPIHHIQIDDNDEFKFSCVTNIQESICVEFSQGNYGLSKDTQHDAMELKKSSSEINKVSSKFHSEQDFSKRVSPREPISQLILQIQEKYNFKGKIPIQRSANPSLLLPASRRDHSYENARNFGERSSAMKITSAVFDPAFCDKETRLFRTIQKQLDNLAHNMQTGKAYRCK